MPKVPAPLTVLKKRPKSGGAAPADPASGQTPAMSASEVRAGQLPFQPMTLGVVMALQRIKSPLLETSGGIVARDIANALWIMITPISAVRRAIELETSPGVFPAMNRLVDEMSDGIDMALFLPINLLLNAKILEIFADSNAPATGTKKF